MPAPFATSSRQGHATSTGPRTSAATADPWGTDLGSCPAAAADGTGASRAPPGLSPWTRPRAGAWPTSGYSPR
eukprot:11171295-Lingulodinium_polyedra.AAC.1